jgi:hypothetical protein
MTLNGNTDETNGYNTKIKNGLANDANMVKAVIPPIGSILAWDKTLTGTPALPDGWVECNGQTISDADSPYNGVTIRNLNGGTYRMLRGASTSGGTGGADTHTLSVAELPAHVHTYSDTVCNGANSHGGTGGDEAYQDTTSNTSSIGSGSAHNNLPAYTNMVWILRIK